MKTYKNKDWWEIIAIIIVGFGLVALAVYSIKIYNKGYFLFSGWDKLDVGVTGLFGDFFGGVVGSLWALAGVFLYFSALKVQQKQLEAQKKDMKLNEKLVSQQQFEATFFGLLQTQKDLKNNLSCEVQRVVRDKYNYNIKPYKSDSNNFFYYILQELKCLYLVYTRDSYNTWEENEISEMISTLNQEADYCEAEGKEFNYISEFNLLLDDFNLRYITKKYHVKESNVKLAKEKDTEKLMCCSIYGHVFLTYQEQLGHYFRHLYNIVKFLDNERERCLNEIQKEDNYLQLREDTIKRFSNYFSFVHSMLSTSELAVLFYNSMLFPKAKELYVKYGMFNNLLDGNLIKKEHANLIEGANLKNKKELFQEIIDRLVEERNQIS